MNVIQPNDVSHGIVTERPRQRACRTRLEAGEITRYPDSGLSALTVDHERYHVIIPSPMKKGHAKSSLAVYLLSSIQ